LGREVVKKLKKLSGDRGKWSRSGVLGVVFVFRGH